MDRAAPTPDEPAPPADAPATGRVSGSLRRGTNLEPELVDALLDTVMQRSGTGVVLLDNELRYVMVNDVAAEINGLAAEDHLGRRIQDVLPGVAPAVAPQLRRVLATGVPELQLEISGETPSLPGEKRWWSSSAVRLERPGRPAEPLVAVVFTEVTDQYRANHRLRQLIDSLFTFVGLLEPDGTLVEANRTALDAGGLTRDEIVGLPFWEASWWTHDPAVVDQLRRAVVRAAQGESSRYDVVMRMAGGVLVPIDFMLAPIVEDGAVVAMVPSGLEISARMEESNRLAALARLSGVLNAAEVTGDVVRAVLGGVDAMEDATFVNVGIIDSDARLIRIAMEGVDPDLVDRWSVIPLDSDNDTPFHEAIATGDYVTVADDDEREVRFPHLVEDSRKLGLVGTVALPLFDEYGVALGVIGLGWPEPITVSPELNSRFRLIVDLCSQALQRSRRTESLADLVLNLQRELLPVPDPPAGLDVAVEYRPAVHDIGFGGDWYDVIDLGDRIALVVGDVAGHGVAAAAQMAQIKGVLRGLTTALHLGDLIPAASKALAPDHAEYLATAGVAVIDVAGQSMQWVSAGHPPPAVVNPDGSVGFVEGGLMPPIGLVRSGVAPVEHELGPGSVLVLYTDGLVERRNRSIDDGLDALLGVLSDLPDGADAVEVRDRVLDRLIAGGSRDDDVAIIVVRVPPS